MTVDVVGRGKRLEDEERKRVNGNDEDDCGHDECFGQRLNPSKTVGSESGWVN